jgi:hypothetical protein
VLGGVVMSPCGDQATLVTARSRQDQHLVSAQRDCFCWSLWVVAVGWRKSPLGFVWNRLGLVSAQPDEREKTEGEVRSENDPTRPSSIE